jgi:hypothetical protein
MGTAKTIPIGGDKAAPYLAFGDDSQYGDFLAYAFVVVRRKRLPQVERRLADLKDSFKIPREIPLHCRVLFSGDLRRKTGLGHLLPCDAQSIVARAVTIMNDTWITLRYARDTYSQMKQRLGSQIELTHETDGTKITLPVNADSKGFLSMLMQASLMPNPGPHVPALTDCEIIVAEDYTKVGFIGPGRKRADRMYNGFSDIGAPEGGVFQLNPTVLKAEGAPLLQLADIAAYICSHAADAAAPRNFFREQLSLVRRWTSVG